MQHLTPYYVPYPPPNDIIQILSDQRKNVADGIIQVKSKGDTWYLVALPWYQLWSRYVGFDQAHCPGLKDNYPGPIDNSSIVDGNGELLPGMTEKNFMVLPEDCWNKLFNYYHLCGRSVSSF